MNYKCFHFYFLIKKEFITEANCQNYRFHKTRGNKVIYMKIKFNFARDYSGVPKWMPVICQQHVNDVVQTIRITSSISDKRKNVPSTKQLAPIPLLYPQSTLRKTDHFFPSLEGLVTSAFSTTRLSIST